MLLDKDKIKESLTEDEVHSILKDIGSNEAKRDKQGNPMFQTVCHHGKSHKLYYYHDSKTFHCYTDCSDSFDIYELVVRNRSISFPQAVQYVANLTGKTFGFGSGANVSNTERISDWHWINRHKKKDKINMELPSYDERVLDIFLPYPHESWLSEGISYETQRKYEIGYYIKEEKISIPHRSMDNKLVGIRGRATLESDIEAGKKYMPLTIQNKLYNHQLMFNLYGLNVTQDNCRRLRKAIIFEGEKSVLKTEDMFGENNFSCAVCSSNITNFHRDIILSLGVEEVFIAFDTLGAEATELQIQKYKEKLLKFAHKFSPFVRTYIIYDEEGLLPAKSSPVDGGKETLLKLMKNKFEITTVNGVD